MVPELPTSSLIVGQALSSRISRLEGGSFSLALLYHLAWWLEFHIEMLKLNDAVSRTSHPRQSTSFVLR